MPKPNVNNRAPKRTYIKIYINANIGTGLINDIFLLLAGYSNKDNDIHLTADRKRIIADRLKITLNSLDVEICRLIDRDLIQRAGKGLYMINPVRASKGYGIDFLYDRYLTIKHSCTKDKELNDVKYKLKENRGKKRQLPDNIIPLNGEA